MKLSTDLNVCLYTGYSPRANALKERVEKACGNLKKIQVINEMNSVRDYSDNGNEHVIFLDLPNIKQSAVQTITSARNICEDKCKLIAIHIYTTKLLVDPLFDAGIHGYLTYEPSVDEIKKAVSIVANGKLYLPDQVY